MKTAHMVASGSYSDYQVLAVFLDGDLAQRWADAYNSERESLYRDDAEVEEITLFEVGDALPRRVTYWNADDKSEWEITYVQAPSVDQPPIVEPMGKRTLARNYPTREAARAAVDGALTAQS